MPIDSNPRPLQIRGRGADSCGVLFYDVRSPNNGYGRHILRVLPPSHPAPERPHNFLFVLPVEPELGVVYGDGLETIRSLGAHDEHNLTLIQPSFALDPWYADHPTDPKVRYETFMTEDLVPWVRQNLARTGREQNWLIGFSKSGLAAQHLLLKHPDLFARAACWDFPADMATHDRFGPSSADVYGTDENFQANYRPTRAFMDAHKEPFLGEDRLWIGGYEVYGDDMANYDELLTSAGIVHTTGTPELMPHTWDGGWVPSALDGLTRNGSSLKPAAFSSP
jgi:hypothetical protein